MKLNIHLNSNIFKNEKALKLLAELTDPELVNIPSDSFHLVASQGELEHPAFPNFLRDRCKIIVWNKDLKQK
jgi:hypothetical protein